eukprot:67527_1
MEQKESFIDQLISIVNDLNNTLRKKIKLNDVKALFSNLDPDQFNIMKVQPTTFYEKAKEYNIKAYQAKKILIKIRQALTVTDRKNITKSIGILPSKMFTSTNRLFENEQKHQIESKTYAEEKYNGSQSTSLEKKLKLVLESINQKIHSSFDVIYQIYHKKGDNIHKYVTYNHENA